jgi:membrane-bound metal-dependent hydrolase YbcI (DUF457 family)
MLPLLIGLWIAACLLSLAIAFFVLQYRERRQRGPELSPEDHAYFRAKDARRFSGSLLMTLIAVGMIAGLVLNPRRDPATRDAWAVTWIVVLVLVGLLMVLAVWDWMALRAYAWRHRRLLDRERSTVIDSLRRRQPPTDGDGA